MKKLIVINLIFVLIIFLSVEIFVFLNPEKSTKEFMNYYNKGVGYEALKLEYALNKEYDIKVHEKEFRPVNYGKGNKKSIIFIGGSYTRGETLENNQTLPYKITKLTDRTTYNLGIGGAGINHMLYHIENSDTFDKIEDAEYVIYTFIWDHLFRLYQYNFSPFTMNGYHEINPRYELVEGKLKYVKPKFQILSSLYIVKKLQKGMINYKFKEYKKFELLESILSEIVNHLKQNSPNIKPVILLYKDSGGVELNPERIKKFQDLGYIVINSEELVGHELMSKKWRSIDKEHPSEAAFNDVAKALIKELNL